MTETGLVDQKTDTATSGSSGEGKPEIKPIEPPPEPEHDFLDAAKLRLFRDGSGRSRATIEDTRSYPDVKLVRCFPQTVPDQFWALTYQDNRVIGVIDDPRDLDRESYRVALDCLEVQYFMPVVTAIRSLKEEFGAVYFEVETDRGPRSFVAKAVRDSIDETEAGGVILVDVDENRYCIPNWLQLDEKSQRYLERII